MKKLVYGALMLSLPALASAATQTDAQHPANTRISADKTGLGRWTAGSALPVGVAEVGVTELDGKIYVVGGTEKSGPGMPVWNSARVHIFDPKSQQWREAAPLPSGLTHAGVAGLGGKLYVVGGFTSPVHMGAQNIALVYDPANDSWSHLAGLPEAKGSVAVAAVDGKIHIFGGRHPDKVVRITPPEAPPMFAAFGTRNTHEVYDPSTGKWSEASPLPGPARDHMGIAVLNGKIHIFGGRVADVTDNLDRHDVYDPATGNWSSAAPLPEPRSSGAATVVEGRIVYAGGECKPGGAPNSPNAYDEVTIYDPANDSWSILTPLPSARHAFGAATVGDRAYFIGGAPVCGGGATTDLLELQLP